MEKFMILDVEGSSICRPYNVGYIIGDKKGNIYCSHSAALHPHIMENLKQRALHGCKEMTLNNVKEIEQDNSQKYQHYFNTKEFYNMFMDNVRKYQISKIWAYNVSFDKAAMGRGLSDIDNNFTNKFEWLDIQTAILFTKLLKKKYIKFCKKNNFLTEKGNIQTKAEVVYRYLFNDLDFVEEHTGLADTLIEYKILLEAFKTKKKIDGSVVCCWKKIKNFCEVEGL